MLGLFNRSSKKRKTVYVTTDETGDPGSSYPGGRFYIVAGCVVDDMDAFRDVSQKYSRMIGGEEIKFNLDPDFRIPILEEAEPYVSAVYYVVHRKDPKIHNSPEWDDSENKKVLHKGLLNKLANRIIRDYDVDEFIVDIDESELIANRDAEEIFEDNYFIKEEGTSCKARAEKSKYNPGLQTNDFFVGAIGYYYNTPVTTDPTERSDVYTSKIPKKMKRVKNRRAL